MQIQKINPVNPEQRLIRLVVERLRKGDVIAYPTDTIYGIGCDILQKGAIERLYKIKGKDPEQTTQLSLPKSYRYQHVCPGEQPGVQYHEAADSGSLHVCPRGLP